MLVSISMTFHSKNENISQRRGIMDSSPIIFYTLVVWVVAAMTADGQINRYINPAWLEMDANSEFYPGGEVVSQILRAYGLSSSDGAAGGYVPGPRYNRPAAVLDRNGYGGGGGGGFGGYYYYPRNRLAGAGLNYAYDSDPLARQEYADRGYDYTDNTIRNLNRYRNTLMDVPIRRNRINVADVPRIAYYQSDIDEDRDSLIYSRSRPVASDPFLQSRGRETGRLIPRSTVAPVSDEKPKNA